MACNGLRTYNIDTQVSNDESLDIRKALINSTFPDEKAISQFCFDNPLGTPK